MADNKEHVESTESVEEETVDQPEILTEEELSETELTSQKDENEKIEELTKELNEMEDKYLRLQAELQNILRRHKKEKQDDRKFRSQSLATELLPVIDNLERALTIEVSDEAGENLKKGIEMVMGSFKAALEKEGVEVLNPVNELFDPQFHEAYTSVPAEEGQEAGTVVQVFEKGYVLNDRILRAAKVSVAE